MVSEVEVLLCRSNRPSRDSFSSHGILKSAQGARLILIIDTTPTNYLYPVVTIELNIKEDDVGFIVFVGPLWPTIFVNTNSLRDMTTEAPRAVVRWFIDLNVRK